MDGQLGMNKKLGSLPDTLIETDGAARWINIMIPLNDEAESSSILWTDPVPR
jgi:hypothetical protein